VCQDVLFFDSMLTPKIITFVYWLMIVGVVIAGLKEIFSSSGSIIQGVAILFGGLLAARIWSELLIVLFKINDNLQKILEKD